jgi:hypothetical protein
LDSVEKQVSVNVLAARTFPFVSARGRTHANRFFWLGTAVVAAGLAGVLGWFLLAWPPHEDEALALFVGRGSFGTLLQTVIGERGGAPLHFVFAWIVVHLGGGLGALRVVSLLFAVASVPLVALLGARLADRTVGLTAAALASGTWVVIFHGVYGRMYSLFLFTSLLSFLGLLSALERGGRRRFFLWGLALVATLASHPYAVLVIAGQALFVCLRRERLRPAFVTLAAVGLAAIPFWWADIVLRDRFDVGVGGGGRQLGSPGSVLHYFWWVSGDFGAGHYAWSAPVLLLALAGTVLLVRQRPRSVLLAACVIAVPAAAFMVATLGSSTSPESRHLIFALPFFSTVIAVAVVELGRLRPPFTAAVAFLTVAALIVGEVRWAHQKTPPLFDGDPPTEVQAAKSAAAWLASTSRPDDVLLGYEPLFLRAWESNRSFSSHVIPRADPVLFARALKNLRLPLGHGIWVFDASDTTNVRERQTIRFALPQPAAAFEGHVYGPYLVIRSRKPLLSPARYLAIAETVMRLGRELQISDAGVNLQTMLQAESRL